MACIASLGLLCGGLAAATPVTAAAASPQQGIDVSYWQGPHINWSQVAHSGISFAYIRAAEGSNYTDPYFASNWSGALGAGIVPGAYLYFHPSQDPNAEAGVFIQQLESVDFTTGMLTPAIDVETTDNEPAATVVANLQIVINDLESAFHTAPVIYASPDWWDSWIGSSNFVGDPLWVADWNSGPPSLPANGWGGNGYQTWQYTSNGSVPGISGAVDLDVGNPGPPVFTGSPPPVRGIALQSNGTAGYILDGYGGIHAFGGAPAITGYAYWRGWNIARAIALRPDGVSGYVLDGWGGIHPFGGAPAIKGFAYWPGWDIARAMVLRPDGVSGYVLDGYGGVHPFGGAPAVNGFAYWPGWDIARAMVLRPDGVSGYVLDGWGGVHPFGGAPAVKGFAYWPGWDIARGLVLASDGNNTNMPADSGWVLDGWGGVHPFGGAPSVSFAQTAYYPGWDIVRAIAFVSSANEGAVANSELAPASFSANIP
jgi:lysozyme